MQRGREPRDSPQRTCCTIARLDIYTYNVYIPLRGYAIARHYLAIGHLNARARASRAKERAGRARRWRRERERERERSGTDDRCARPRI